MKPEDLKALVNYQKDKGKAALLDAAENGRFNLVISVLETYDVEFLTTDNDQCSALNILQWS